MLNELKIKINIIEKVFWAEFPRSLWQITQFMIDIAFQNRKNIWVSISTTPNEIVSKFEVQNRNFQILKAEFD